MRQPRPEAFDPKARQRTPDPVNLTGVTPITPKDPQPTSHQETAEASKEENSPAVPRYHGGMVSRHHDTTVFSSEINVVTQVRKAVKEFGKEAATHRFTQAEKKTIAEMVFTYQNRNIRTSENEITRIAINYLFHDYQRNGEQSFLHQVLLSLNQ